jgi:hypothetical protein
MKFAFIAITVILAPLALAAPTTKPVAKVQPLDARDSVLVTNDKAHYSIRIPKEWKQSQKSDQMIEYELPRNPRDQWLGGHFSVYSGGLCHPKATLPDEVDANKQVWQQQYKGFKPIKEEAVDLNGTPATLITYDRSYDVQTTDSRTHASKNIERKMRCMSLICVKDGMGYFGDFAIDSVSFEPKANLVKRTMAGLNWTEKK